MKEKLAAIHNQARLILETVGIKLHHAEQLFFTAHGSGTACRTGCLHGAAGRLPEAAG